MHHGVLHVHVRQQRAPRQRSFHSGGLAMPGVFDCLAGSRAAAEDDEDQPALGGGDFLGPHAPQKGSAPPTAAGGRRPRETARLLRRAGRGNESRPTIVSLLLPVVCLWARAFSLLVGNTVVPGRLVDAGEQLAALVVRRSAKGGRVHARERT